MKNSAVSRIHSWIMNDTDGKTFPYFYIRDSIKPIKVYLKFDRNDNISVSLVDKVNIMNKIIIRTSISFGRVRIIKEFSDHILTLNEVLYTYLKLVVKQSKLLIVRFFLEYITKLLKGNESVVEIDVIKKTSIYYELKYSIEKYRLPIKLNIKGIDSPYSRKIYNIL